MKNIACVLSDDNDTYFFRGNAAGGPARTDLLRMAVFFDTPKMVKDMCRATNLSPVVCDVELHPHNRLFNLIHLFNNEELSSIVAEYFRQEIEHLADGLQCTYVYNSAQDFVMITQMSKKSVEFYGLDNGLSYVEGDNTPISHMIDIYPDVFSTNFVENMVKIML